MKYDIRELVKQCNQDAQSSEESVLWDRMPDVGSEVLDDATQKESTEED